MQRRRSIRADSAPPARVRRARRSSSSLAAATLTHLDASGQAHMVDVAAKAVTAREAVARASVMMSPATLRVLASGRVKKGDVLAVARVAGIQAAKCTPQLIPLCHTIALTRCEVSFETRGRTLLIEARVSALDRTGAEMEALTAASIAALTIYDMLKSLDRGMSIERIALHEKRGGKSGTWTRRARRMG